MAYGQPGRRITEGPAVGPTSAYPMFRTPASICFNAPNDRAWPGCAAPGSIVPEPAAAIVIPAPPRNARRPALIAFCMMSPFTFGHRLNRPSRARCPAVGARVRERIRLGAPAQADRGRDRRLHRARDRVEALLRSRPSAD